MKNFEDKFDIDGDGNGGDCDCECSGIPITCEECKVIAEYWYRQALEYVIAESIKRIDGLSHEESLTRVLYEELGEDEQETTNGESK